MTLVRILKTTPDSGLSPGDVVPVIASGHPLYPWALVDSPVSNRRLLRADAVEAVSP